MATKTLRENFVNTFGKDLLMAYFDLGADGNGVSRYNFASYAIGEDQEWVKAIGALRTAACLFKLPMDASASVEIVMDAANPAFRTTFSVHIHNSSHFIDAACKRSAIDEVSQAASELQTVTEDPLSLTESAAALPKPTCSVSQSCDGKFTTTCIDPVTTEAACVQRPSGVYELVCVPRIPPI